jgi:hypothetical protein
MATSKNEIIYSVLEKIRPHISDDESIARRQLSFDIDVVRAKFLRNEFNKNRTIDSGFIQDLGCVPLETVDRAECCEVEVGCHVVRTIAKIPQSIEQHSATTITRIGPIDKLQVSYSLVPYERVPYIGNNKFNKNQVFAYIKDDRIYIASKSHLIKHLEYINIQGVFEDPEEAINFVDCDNKPCYSRDGKYPTNKWLVDFIIRQLIQDYSPVAIAPSDVSNDTASAVTPQQQQ